MSYLLVLSSFPDRESALRAAERLIGDRLAACVQVGGTVTSMYHWRGKIETAEEVTLHAKIRAASYARVEAAIRSLHPYELPEILAVPFTAGLEAYFRWIDAETASSESIAT
jgi:periplasmic divalent cation tolerance protein